MSKYKMNDGSIVDTDLSIEIWVETTIFTGNSHVSVNTGSEHKHETLYKSAKGRYYIEKTSDWQGSIPSAKFITPLEAAKWIILNEEELPEDLLELKNDCVE